MVGLGKLFHPNLPEIWKQLADEVGGRFQAATWSTGTRVDVEVGGWTITLDTYTVMAGQVPVTMTRMRAPYVNLDGFRFRIYTEGFFSSIRKFFGMQDIVVGFNDLDDRYIIQGNDEQKVKLLFSQQRLRELLLRQKDFDLVVNDNDGLFGTSTPENVDILSFEKAAQIQDIDELKDLFDIFGETLQILCQMGSAYEDDPGMTL